MRAHLHDLRSEVDATEDAQAMVDRFAADWRAAGLDEATTSLLEFSEKLTRTPSQMSPGDVDALRDAGWSERAIHDATQVCAYFNYINRIADALGVEHEDFLDELGRPTG